MSFYGTTRIEQNAWRSVSALRQAFEESRHRSLVSKMDQQCLKEFMWRDCGFWNVGARRRWARIVCEEIADLLRWSDKSYRHEGPVFLVTMLDNTGAIGPGDTSLDLDFLKRNLTSGLRNLDFVGFIEPAFYVNLQSGINVNFKRCIYWHLHALVWGIDSKEAKRLEAELNASGRYVSIADGLKPVTFKRVRQKTLTKVVAYLQKPPANGYRISKCDRMVNGEPMVDSDGVVLAWFKQGKAKLRKSELLQLFHSTKYTSLDRLITGGGKGSAIARQSKRRFNNLASKSPVSRGMYVLRDGGVGRVRKAK